MRSGTPTLPVDSIKPVGAPPPPPPGPPPALNPPAPKPPAGNTDRSDLLAAIRRGKKLNHVETAEEKEAQAQAQPKQVSKKKKYKAPTEEANAGEWSSNESSSESEESDEEPVVSATQLAATTSLLSQLTAAFQGRRRAVAGHAREYKEKKDVEKEKEKPKSKPPLPPRPPKQENQEKKAEVSGTPPTGNKAAAIPALTVVIPPYPSAEDESFPSPPSPLASVIWKTRRSSSLSEELPPPPSPSFSPPLPKSVEEKENENRLTEDMPSSPGKRFKEESPTIIASASTLHKEITFIAKEQDEKMRMVDDLLTAYSANKPAEIAFIRSKLLEIVNLTAKEDQKVGMSKSLNDLPESVRLTEDRSTWNKSLLVLYNQVGKRKPSPKEVISFAMRNGLIGSISNEFRAFAGSGMQYP